MRWRGERKRASGQRPFGRTPDSLAPDQDRGERDAETDEFNAEFWSRGPDDPPPAMSPRLETPPPPSRLAPVHPMPVARDEPPAAARFDDVDEEAERHETRLAEFADTTKADLSRIATRLERAVDARRDEAEERHEARLVELADATRAELSRIAAQFGRAIDARRDDAERHEVKLVELADATRAELSGIAAQFGRAIDARRDDAERHEVKLVELADATRAELSRIAAQFEHVAAERIAQMEEMVTRAAAQADAISQRMAGLDQREAEFTRRVEEGLEHLDSQLSAWRHELTRLRGEQGAALDRAAAEQLTELVNRVDEHHGSFGDAIAKRIEELENAVAEQRQLTERRRSADVERRAVEDQDELTRARVARASEIHWTQAE
jgi:hypothetical protein